MNRCNTDKQNLEKKTGVVGKKIPGTSDLVTTTVLNAKFSEVEKKIPNTSSSVTKTVINTTARLKQAELVTRTDFDEKLTSFDRKITSNKTKYLEVRKKLNSLITKDYNFSFGRICFKSNDGSQNTFVYQPKLDKLEKRKAKLLIMVSIGNQMEYIILNLSHYILLFYIAENLRIAYWEQLIQ